MLVASAVAYTCYRVKLGGMLPLGWLDVGFVVLEVIFFAASRDTLRKYYTRSQQLLARVARPHSHEAFAPHREPAPTDNGNPTPRP